MATQKVKKVERNYISSPEELNAIVDQIGAETENPPVSLDRGSYVQGSLSLGSLILDLITGGGVPPGKITKVFGPEGSSKSTAAGHTIASATSASIPVFYFDHEASADAKYFSALGAKIRMADGSKNPNFHYYQPDTAEQTYRTMAQILRVLPNYVPIEGGRPKPQALFVIDSIASMLPESVEEDDEKVRMAAAASVHSQFLPVIKTKLGRKNVSLFATNQTRLNPGAMFGNPEYEPGGQAWRFYPDLNFRLSAVKKPFMERNRFMRFINVSTKKNKQFPPFLESEETLAVAFGRGYERGRDSKGYLTMTGQISGTSRKVIQFVTDKDYSWNNEAYSSEEDLMKVLCSNEFRAACREQLQTDVPYKLFFSSNNWADLYSDFDEEAVADEPLVASSSEEEEAPVVHQKRGRKPKIISEAAQEISLA